MPQVLSISLRPKALSQLIGQEKVVAAIRLMVAKRPPRAWMFHGGSGNGKTSFAKIIALSYQCSHQETWGEPCDACWKKYESFAIHEINAGDVTQVEKFRQIIEMAKYKPLGSAKRVIILDEIHNASSNSMNALLTPVENAYPHLVWILCTTEPNKILATARRRCVQMRIRGLSYDDVEKLLTLTAQRESITRPLVPLIEAVNEAGLTSPGLLLMALEKYAAGLGPRESALGVEGSNVDTYKICKAVTNGNWGELKAALKEVTPDDARFVRISVSGWLRGCLIREASVKHATSLGELTAQAPLEDNLLLLWLWAALWKICARYRT
jgi:DNA polymerase-3 subunit gamma/tau